MANAMPPRWWAPASSDCSWCLLSLQATSAADTGAWLSGERVSFSDPLVLTSSTPWLNLVNGAGNTGDRKVWSDVLPVPEYRKWQEAAWPVNPMSQYEWVFCRGGDAGFLLFEVLKRNLYNGNWYRIWEDFIRSCSIKEMQGQPSIWKCKYTSLREIGIMEIWGKTEGRRGGVGETRSWEKNLRE